MPLAGFEDIPISVGRPKRLIVSDWGREKSGKTHFALSFPEPIYVFDFDRRLDNPARDYPDKQMYRKQYRDPTLGTIQDHEKIYNEFLKDLRTVVKGIGYQGTIVIDTHTAVWQVIQSTYVEKIRQQKLEDGKKFMTFDYALANRHFTEVIETIKDNDSINCVLIGKAQDAYNSQGAPSGEYKPQQNKDVPFLVDMIIRCERDGAKYQCVIEESGCKSAVPGLSMAGLIIEDPTYEKIMELLG